MRPINLIRQPQCTTCKLYLLITYVLNYRSLSMQFPNMTAYSPQKHLQPLLCCILLCLQYTYVNVYLPTPCLYTRLYTLCFMCNLTYTAMFSGPAPECTLLHHSHCNQWSEHSIKSRMHAESQVNSDDYVIA